MWIKNSLRMYWHGQTVAAFSLQLFTLSCASETVTLKKKLCSPLGSKQWQGLNFSRPSVPLLQLSSRQLNLKGPFFKRYIYLCTRVKWKYWPLCQSNAVLGACQQSQKKNQILRFQYYKYTCEGPQLKSKPEQAVVEGTGPVLTL